MKSAAHITHSAPGRCRLKIPSKRHDADYFQFLKEKFIETDGIEQVNTNPIAASVLILYNDEHLSFEELQAHLQRSEHFELTAQSQSVAGLGSAIQGINHIDKLLKNTTSGQINFNALLFIVLVIIAVRQLRQGAVFGPASTLFWYALQILAKEKND
jgi:hypothetical protein